MANLFSITLDVEKETKGAVRYAERGEADSHKLSTLYIRKSAFKGEWPKAITVTIATVTPNKAIDKAAAE